VPDESALVLVPKPEEPGSATPGCRLPCSPLWNALWAPRVDLGYLTARKRCRTPSFSRPRTACMAQIPQPNLRACLAVLPASVHVFWDSTDSWHIAQRCLPTSWTPCTTFRSSSYAGPSVINPSFVGHSRTSIRSGARKVSGSSRHTIEPFAGGRGTAHADPAQNSNMRLLPNSGFAADGLPSCEVPSSKSWLDTTTSVLLAISSRCHGARS
jgi:hypothetical protein